MSFPRVKLLCSYAGKILSRSCDGKLRYVGGETRIIAVNRDVTYSELMSRIVELHAPTVGLKYQLPDEDLDALVSLCSDEDVENMMDEYDGQEGNHRIRLFLFSSVEYEVDHMSECNADAMHSDQSMLDGGAALATGKRSESGASDNMRDLDDMIGLYSDDTQRTSAFEDTIPLPSDSQLLDEVFLLEQFPQVFSQSVQAGNSNTSVYTCKALPIQTVAGVCPKEHVGPYNCGQFPVHSVSNTPVASSFCESATLGSNKLSDCENSFGFLTSMTGDNLMQECPSTGTDLLSELLSEVHSDTLSCYKTDELQMANILERKNQLEFFGAVQGSLPNLEAGDFTRPHQETSISNENGYEPPALCLQFHSAEPLQSLGGYSIIGHKDLEIEHQIPLYDYESLPTCKSLEKVAGLEGVESSYNHTAKVGTLASDQLYNFLKVNLEVPLIPEAILCEVSSSDKLLYVSGTESPKEQDTKITLTGDLGLKDPPLDESSTSVNKNPSEHIQKITTMEHEMAPLTLAQNVVNIEPLNAEITASAGLLQPEMCFLSSLAAENFDSSTSPLEDSLEVANNVNKGLQELIAHRESMTMSELPQSCEIPAPEQIGGMEDIDQQFNDVVNEYVQEQVLIEDYAGNQEVTKDEIFEVSTCTSMDIKADLETIASEAEHEATALGLQIIRNSDLEERRELGSGTFGTVYHGKWRGSDVAIKRIKASCFSGPLSEQERLKADFWKEACILAQLHHPNIVAFYGVVPDGTLGTVTEYMINGSLKQVLRKKSDRILDSRRRLFIAMDAAFGMEYLHSKKVVHFDLKCENLLVNMRDPHRPICKVGDFGLSKVKQRTMVSGGVQGTLPWMAPELLNGSSNMVSEKVDVFSFGIVMWELLTSEEPYADLHYGAILGGILSDSLRPPVPDGCEPAWRLLMERCWSTDPVLRPTFAEIASALRLMAASELVKVQCVNQVLEVVAQEVAS